MRRRAGARVEAYAALAAVGLVAALALRRPELAAMAAPFALVLALGLTTARDPHVQLSFDVAAERTVEDALVPALATAQADTAVSRLELLFDLPENVELAGADARALRLRPREPQTVDVELRCRRWGVYDIGAFEVRAWDVFRLVTWEQRYEPTYSLKAYPKDETVRRLLVPVETQALTGSDVARTKGDGIEYADLRDYVVGDRLRSINWRASARRNALVVNERHPERNTDVVLFLDSFADLRGSARSTLDDAVRAAATIATRYLARRDRVGFVTLGGLLRWLQPGLGMLQHYRLIESLLETGVEPTYTWRNVDVLPAGILPPKALVVGLTPLVDRRFVSALEDLRARGYDIAVVEIDPLSVVEPGAGAAARLAYRLWLLEREVFRAHLRSLGVAVATWPAGVALESALEEVRTYRRHARLARV